MVNFDEKSLQSRNDLSDKQKEVLIDLLYTFHDFSDESETISDIKDNLEAISVSSQFALNVFNQI